MNHEYDYIFLGNGPVVHFVANFLSRRDLRILVVTNHNARNANFTQIPYGEFFSKIEIYVADKVVLSIRQSTEAAETLKTIFGNLSAKSLSFKGVMVFSSSAVYGENLEENFENDELNGNTEYALLKIESEKRVREITDNHMILRISNLYGTTEMKGVVNNLLSDIHAKNTIKLPLSSVIRDFVHVLDLSKFLLYMSKRDLVCGTINFSSGESTTLEELAKIMIDYSGGDIRISRGLMMPDIIHSNISNVKLTGFYPIPFIELRKGIAMMFDQKNE